MTKEQVIGDYEFRVRCDEYGIDYRNFEIINETILLYTPKKRLYVIMDKNYNTIGIFETQFHNMHLTQEEIVTGYNELYETVDEKLGCAFPYPFQNYSLRQMVELGNRVDVIPINHGHSSIFMVNMKKVDEKTNKIYLSLLAYIQFLSIQISNYYQNAYKMKLMGFDYPDVYSYIKAIMNGINGCIEDCIKIEKTPFPVDVLRSLGENIDGVDSFDHHLYHIISLILKNNGYRIKKSKLYLQIEEVENQNIDLSIFAQKLLKLLEEPQSIIDDGKTPATRKTINLDEYLEEPSEYQGSPTTLVLK